MSNPTIAVQMHMLRHLLAEDSARTLESLADAGVRAVEATGYVDDPETYLAGLSANGLHAPIAHAFLITDRLDFGEGNIVEFPSHETVFDAAKRLGAGTVIDPMVGAELWRDREDIENSARTLNEASRLAASYGLRVGYHNHSMEFNHSFDGVSAYEHFVTLLDDDVVLELDVFWAATAGQDVEALIRRLGSRVIALHIKDGVPGVNPFAEGAAPFDATALIQAPAGAGELPIEKYLRSATSLEFAIVEFDHSANLLQDIGASVRFLQSLGISA